jgi:hypothetical protein
MRTDTFGATLAAKTDQPLALCNVMHTTINSQN